MTHDAEAQAYTDRRQYGSRPWLWDPREKGFSHKKYFGAANITLLPPDGLHRARRPVENQLSTLRCGPTQAVVGNAYIRRVRFSPEYQTVKISLQQNRPVDDYGSEPKAVMNSLRDDGSLYIDMSPVALAKDGQQESVNPKRFSKELDEKAQLNRIIAYLGVDDQYDYFDDIRWALYRAYKAGTDTGPVVHAFSPWYEEWTVARKGVVAPVYSNMAGWHAYLFIDWCLIDGIPYLIAQNSYGENVGDRGFFYFPREVVNREFAKWGSALKIPTGALTEEQIATAKRLDIYGTIQRAILAAWRALSEKFGAYA
jgi:hypothetical protein